MARNSVRIGCCVPINQIQEAARAGFDYNAPSAAVIAELTPEQFERAKQDLLASPLSWEAFNGFIRRKELMMVGPAVDMAALKEYADRTLDRCQQLGGKIVVWGSAGSRNVPEGFSRERAWAQIAMSLDTIAPIATGHQIVIFLNH